MEILQLLFGQLLFLQQTCDPLLLPAVLFQQHVILLQQLLKLGIDSVDMFVDFQSALLWLAK